MLANRNLLFSTVRKWAEILSTGGRHKAVFLVHESWTFKNLFCNFTPNIELFEKDIFYKERENQNAANQCSVLISVLRSELLLSCALESVSHEEAGSRGKNEEEKKREIRR